MLVVLTVVVVIVVGMVFFASSFLTKIVAMTLEITKMIGTIINDETAVFLFLFSVVLAFLTFSTFILV